MILLQAVPTTTATPVPLPTLLLSAMVWVPALAALALLFFPARTELQRQRIRSFGIGATSLVLAFAVFMWYGFRDQSGTYAYEETRQWLPAVGSSTETATTMRGFGIGAMPTNDARYFDLS